YVAHYNIDALECLTLVQLRE
ncbi:MAG: hypothetical protein ACKVKF_21915, partial [Rhodobacterales bacterium]